MNVPPAAQLSLAQQNVVLAIRSASATVADFCTQFHRLGDPNQYGYLQSGITKRVPSELGLTDSFVVRLAFLCGPASVGGKVLTKINFAADEVTTGYDFMLEFLVDNITYRYYLQAKTVSEPTIHINYSKTNTPIFSQSSGANSKRQWILLRDFVAKEIIANGLNKQQIRVMGMYILYDRDGVWFVPIGSFQKIYDDNDVNRSIFITSPVDGVFGLTRLMDFFAEDLEKHMNAETFFRPDTKMERYAERKFNKQQSAAKEKEKPFKRDPDEQKKPKPWKDPIIGGGTGGITIQ